MRQIVLALSLLAAVTLLYAVPIARCQWTPVDGYSGDLLACFAQIGSNLFVGCGANQTGGSAVLVSSDQGTSWLSAGLTNRAVRALTTSGSDLYAGTDSGVFLSANNGANWTCVSDGLANHDVRSVAVIGNYLFASTYGGGIFRSTNKGISWSATNEGLTDSNFPCLLVHGTLLFAGADLGGFYVDNGGGLFVSTDSGSTWSDTGWINTSVWCLADRGGSIFVGTGTGVYVTTDSGLSWLYSTSNYATTALAIDGSKIFAGTEQWGIHLSTDDGQTWTGIDWNPVNTGFSEDGGVAMIRSLLIDTNTTSPMLFAANWAGNNLWRRPILEFEPQPTRPPEGTWSAAAAGDSASVYFGTSCVVGGKIYVIGGIQYGGYFTQYHTTVDVFDPSTNTWSTPDVSGTFSPRFHLSASVVDDKIYAFGGLNEPLHDTGAHHTLNIMEIFDPATKSWNTPVTSGPCTPRYGATTAVVNGKIYVIGGFNQEDSSFVSTVEVFDPTTKEWTAPVTESLFTNRVYPVSAVVNGRIYVWGGATGNYTSYDLTALQIFDPATNTWSTHETLGQPTPRYVATACELNGKLYWLGGEKVGADYLNTAEVFDPATNVWSTPITDGQLTARRGLTSASVNGKIYVIGGNTGVSAHNNNEVFTPMRSEVSESTTAPNFDLYPNPTSGIVKIEHLGTGVHHVIVTNILGNKVIEVTVTHSDSFSLDLAAFSKGTYILRFSDGDSTISRAILKE
jgi:N-acetylneuraminic acid mutarotase